MLNQFTSNALDLIIVSGPVEVTSIINFLVQAISKLRISDFAEA